jgi:lipid II:glycine glycyltransferase (peptidoglycan interpeptide bridge formation enzyme)
MAEAMIEESDWNRTLLQLPQAHLLQTSEWAALKARVGWENIQRTWKSENKVVAAASVLKRTLRLGGIGPEIAILYVPRGPLVDWNDQPLVEQVIGDLEKLCKAEKAIFLKLDAEIPLGTGIPGREGVVENRAGKTVVDWMSERGWQISPEQVQFKNTMLLDLSGSEETWLTRMKQKTRYNVRLAQKNGVYVRQAGKDELETLYQMYAETSVRDGFVIRERDYYLDVWTRFMQAGKAHPLVAEVDGETIAGLVLFNFGKRAWYLHGMSTQKHREKMPNYLLQWEAMRLAKSLGCESYDLWGAPDEFTAEDRMFGVYRFKEGLGAEVMRTPGALDYANNRALYFAYMRVLPQVLGLMRRRRTYQTRQEVT